MDKIANMFENFKGLTNDLVDSIGAKRVFHALKQNFGKDDIMRQLSASSGDPRMLIMKLHSLYSRVLDVESRISRIPQHDIETLELLVQNIESTLKMGAEKLQEDPEMARVFATMKPSFIVQTASVNKNNQKKSWTYLLQHASDYSSALDTIIEKQLGEIEKRDVVNVGRTGIEMMEVQEAQLESEREGELFEITEIQLESRHKDDDLGLTEAEVESLHRPDAGSGDDIKIYREVNRIQRQNAEANEDYYKNNREEKTKGGVVSAGVKKK